MLNKSRFLKLISFVLASILIITAALLFVPSAAPTASTIDILPTRMLLEPIVTPLPEVQALTANSAEPAALVNAASTGERYLPVADRSAANNARYANISPAVDYSSRISSRSVPEVPASNTTSEGIASGQSNRQARLSSPALVQPEITAALEAFYLSTNGPTTWITKWDTETDPCTWYGITCTSGLVTQINLEHNGLSGTLPTQIGDLTDLTRLDLTYNALTGTIPDTLGSLTQLRFISLAENQLTGGIPSQLGNLSNLTHLYLYTNDDLTGNIPTELGNLTNLELLYLTHNHLTGSIPASLGSLSALRELSLGDNLLVGSIPMELHTLTNLTVLDFSRNGLTGPIPPELGDLIHLESLSFSWNTLTGSIPTTFGNLAALKELYLYDNQLDGPIPTQLGGLNELRKLGLGHNNLNDEIPPSLGNLPNIIELYLDHNQLTGQIPIELGGLSTLGAIDLSANQLDGPIPTQFGNLTQLVDLYLENNLLSGTIPPSLGNLVNLTILRLNNNALTGGIPTQLSQLTELTYFQLQNNQLTGAIPDLSALTKLNWFQVDHNHLEGAIPTWLGNSPDMVGITLQNNQFTGSIPSQLGSLTGLQYLHLANNQLSGEVPASIANLTAISASQLSIDYNMLTASNSDVISYLNTKNFNWHVSQTIAPDNLQIGSISSSSVQISWDAIPYTADGGNYQVSYSTTTGGPYSPGCTTSDKSQTNCTVNGLNPQTVYYFVVQTYTPAHGAGEYVQQNDLLSSYSQEISSPTFAVTVCDAQPYYNECQALYLLYTDSNGPSWTNHTGWLETGVSPCDWYGVDCDNDGHISQVALSANNIIGGIPPEIGYLSALETLDLSANGLTGSIPTQIGGLVSAITINLSGNDLGGGIPTELSLLPDLETLNLGQNNLGGGIPLQLGSRTSLQTLILADNELTGTIPVELGDLYNLRTFNLRGNSLGNSIPAELGYLTNLQELILDHNQLTGPIPTQFVNLANILEINLRNNQLTGTIPTELGSLTTLQKLILGVNQLSGSIPTELGGLTTLQELVLDHNQLGGDIPTALSTLSTVTQLDLSYNMLTASNAGLVTWLNTKQAAWAATQTVPPTGLQTLALTADSIRVSWTAITYTADGGNYEVGYSSSIGGPFTQSGCTTASKLIVTCDVLNLLPSTSYYFAVRTSTPAHDPQQNALLSGFGTAVQGTTLANFLPVANAGADRDIADSDRSGSQAVTLDGSLSTDQDGTIVSYSWLENSVEIATGVNPQITLALGAHTISLVVTDNKGAQSTPDTVIITVYTPTNDDFANSLLIPNLPYNAPNQTNVSATLETLEQRGSCEGATNIMKTVWYKYTATGTENVTFAASGSAVVKGVSVWTGSALGSLTQVGCATGASASATVTTINGMVYYIRIGSSNGVGGSFTVQATTPLGAPLRNSFSTATPTLKWNRVTDATRYEIQVSTSSTFTTTVFPIASVSSEQPSFTTPTLPEGIYYWRVRAIRGTNTGAWSAFDSFIVDLP